MVSYGLIGTLLHLGQLTVIIGYAVAVFGHSNEWWVLEIFGVNWAKDGFCLSFKDTLIHSHLLCLYLDTASAIALYVLSKRTTNRPELALVKDNVASVFFHGLVHGLLWYQGPLRERAENPDDSIFPLVVVYLFFFSFVCLMTPSPIWFGAVQSFLHTIVLSKIPWILSFTYVNTVIGFNLGIGQILTSPRDIYYTLYPALYAGPVFVATLAEPLLCDNVLVHWGGHIFFDMSIPFGTFLYYFVASAYPPRDVQLAKKHA